MKGLFRYLAIPFPFEVWYVTISSLRGSTAWKMCIASIDYKQNSDLTQNPKCKEMTIPQSYFMENQRKGTRISEFNLSKYSGDLGILPCLISFASKPTKVEHFICAVKEFFLYPTPCLQYTISH